MYQCKTCHDVSKTAPTPLVKKIETKMGISPVWWTLNPAWYKTNKGYECPRGHHVPDPNTSTREQMSKYVRYDYLWALKSSKCIQGLLKNSLQAEKTRLQTAINRKDKFIDLLRRKKDFPGVEHNVNILVELRKEIQHVMLLLQRL